MLRQPKPAVERVTLMPSGMFVAGDHANNDIAVDWKEALVKEGSGRCNDAGLLGELPQIQEQFMEHARFALTHKRILKTLKKQYAQSENE